MNRQPRKPYILAILLPVLSAVDTYAMEPASKVDTSAWMCNFCTYTYGWFGWLDIGPGYASDADLKFADYRGINDEGSFISAFGDIHYRNDDGRYLDIYARDLGTDARQVEARGGREGRYQVRLAYREIRKYRGYGTQTVHLGAGSNKLILPLNWVTARTTDGMSALNASLNHVALDTTRKIFEAGLEFKVTGKWRYDVDFQHTEKNGTRPFGAGVFTIQSSHFPAPVNFTTNRVDMGLDYAGKHSRLRFGFNSSAFNNDYTSITWENPFRPVGSTGVLRAALEPDNTFYQFNLTGSFRPTRKLRFSGRAAISRAKQDEAFLPYSSNPDFDDLTLPRTSLGGKIDTSTLNLAANLAAQVSRTLSFNLRLKVDERDNKTPVDIYTPVITDLEQRPETPSRPYSFKHGQYSADLNWRARPFVSFRAGVKQKDYERTLQSVRETEEHTWWGEANINHWAAAQIRLRVETSKRDISPYLQVSDPGLRENVLMRKFNLADRQRERVILEMDLSTVDRLSIGLSYFISQDSYEQSVLGLLESDEESLSLDLGFVVSPKVSMHAFVTLDDVDSKIHGPAGPGLRPWMSSTEDSFTTFGVSLKGKLSDKLDLAFDLVSADSKGRINTDTGAGEAPLPSLKTDLLNARISLSYRANRRWGWTLYAEHENYNSDDWQVDGLGNDGISAILTLGEVSPDYSVTIVRLHANYSF
jgi:MtrB/PioB family decaheme-associated outer membrane protein